jgi:hypothetical protein
VAGAGCGGKGQCGCGGRCGAPAPDAAPRSAVSASDDPTAAAPTVMRCPAGLRLALAQLTSDQAETALRLPAPVRVALGSRRARGTHRRPEAVV